MRLFLKCCFFLLFIPLLVACGTKNDNPIIGEVAPDFNLTDASGNRVGLADYRGQPVLLYFHMAVG